MAQSMANHELWDYDLWRELSVCSVQLARDAGALTALPVLLSYLAGAHVYAGEFAAASPLIEEADAITAATGNAPMRYAEVFLLAWRGDEAAAMPLIRAAVKEATARGGGRVFGLDGHVRAVLYNGLGRYPAALDGARRACEHDEFGYYGWSLAELIEAGVHSGAVDDAAAALRILQERTRGCDTDWALGILARSKALLGDDQTAELLYRAAIDHLSTAASACISRVRGLCTASGYVGRTDPGTRASSCAPPTRHSPGWEPGPSPSVPAANCSPPETRCSDPRVR
jgi:tetratricopeptide (TPR) repeat protein